MGLRKRREPELPARRPHPDPRVEAELQRILSLRCAAARAETLLTANQVQITNMREKITRHPTRMGHAERKAEVRDRLKESAELEASIRDAHEEIAKRIAVLDDSDLAFLD